MFKRIRSTMSSLAKNWGMTQKVYRALPLEVAGFFIAGALVIGLPLYFFLGWITALIAAIPAGLLAGTFWFSRRAMKAAYKQIEGQPGAAGAVVGSMRGGWIVTPGVAVSKQQDLITRVVGKPGVILIGEGIEVCIYRVIKHQVEKVGTSHAALRPTYYINLRYRMGYLLQKCFR